MWLEFTSINAPGLNPNGLASDVRASPGPGLRSNRHDRAGIVIVVGFWRLVHSSNWVSVTFLTLPWTENPLSCTAFLLL